MTANTVYVASYHAPNGHVSGTLGYFTQSGTTSGPLYFPQDGENGSNGVYAIGDDFPGANFWVDVIFEEEGASLLTNLTNLSITGRPARIAETVPSSARGGVGSSMLNATRSTLRQEPIVMDVPAAGLVPRLDAATPWRNTPLEVRLRGGTILPARVPTPRHPRAALPFSPPMALGAGQRCALNGVDDIWSCRPGSETSQPACHCTW